MEVKRFEGWALLELLGHRRRAGFVRDVEMFGSRMLRIDVPVEAKKPHESGMSLQNVLAQVRAEEAAEELRTTEFYGGGAIYGLHPCDEETARKLAHTTVHDSPIYPYTSQLAITHDDNLPF